MHDRRSFDCFDHVRFILVIAGLCWVRCSLFRLKDVYASCARSGTLLHRFCPSRLILVLPFGCCGAVLDLSSLLAIQNVPRACVGSTVIWVFLIAKMVVLAQLFSLRNCLSTGQAMDQDQPGTGFRGCHQVPGEEVSSRSMHDIGIPPSRLFRCFCFAVVLVVRFFGGICSASVIGSTQMGCRSPMAQSELVLGGRGCGD